MNAMVISIDADVVGGRRECRGVVSRVPMFECLQSGEAQRDEGALLVAATWLWTRFELDANADLVQILIKNKLSLPDPENLKQVDAALRVASHVLFDELYDWCLRSSYVIIDDGCLSNPVNKGTIRGPVCHRRDALQSIS